MNKRIGSYPPNSAESIGACRLGWGKETVTLLVRQNRGGGGGGGGGVMEAAFKGLGWGLLWPFEVPLEEEFSCCGVFRCGRNNQSCVLTLHNVKYDGSATANVILIISEMKHLSKCGFFIKMETVTSAGLEWSCITVKVVKWFVIFQSNFKKVYLLYFDPARPCININIVFITWPFRRAYSLS